jgi:hypothetical protein
MVIYSPRCWGVVALPVLFRVLGKADPAESEFMHKLALLGVCQSLCHRKAFHCALTIKVGGAAHGEPVLLAPHASLTIQACVMFQTNPGHMVIERWGRLCQANRQGSFLGEPLYSTACLSNWL